MFFEFTDIAYSLGNNRRIYVSGALNENEVLIIRGASGAGKSTLLRVFARLQPASDGKCILKGEGWEDMPAERWRTSVFYLAQNPTIFDGTVKSNLLKPFETKFLYPKYHLEILTYAEELLAQLLLPTEILDQDAKTLSGGEAARIVFIRALLIDPHVILLDEPTSALDETSQKAFYDVLSGWLSKPGHAAVIVSHNSDYTSLQNISYLDLCEA